MDWHLCCIATDFGHQRRHTIAIAIHVCSWFVAVAVGNNSMRYEELRKCGKEREREKQKGSCNRASMQHTLRKIQTPSMCCRCQLGRSTNRPTYLPGACCRLTATAICPWPVSLDCLSLCLSIHLSVLPSVLLSAIYLPWGYSWSWRQLWCARLTPWVQSLAPFEACPCRTTNSVAFVRRRRPQLHMDDDDDDDECVWFATENGPNAKRIECNCMQTHPLLWGISVYNLLS